MAGKGMDKGARARRSPAEIAVKAVSLLMLIGGISVLVAMNVGNWYFEYMAEQHITQISATYENLDDPEREMYKAQAISYNERIVSGEPAPEGALPYPEQLFYMHEPMMSYVEIPKLAQKLPIYHGTAEEELMSGIGHLESSSLPIGGQTAHCVLLGHSGMRNARMLDDLHLMEVGDEFVLWTLNEAYAYRVFDKQTVLPEEAEKMVGLEPGRDLLTVITCTPYGLNTHRLVVKAERCEYSPEEVEKAAPPVYVDARGKFLLAGIAIIIAIIAIPAAVGRAVSRVREKRRASLPDMPDFMRGRRP